MRRYLIRKEGPHHWNNFETCWALYDRAPSDNAWYHVLDHDTWREAMDFIDERVRSQ
jgi:hypothetical protein